MKKAKRYMPGCCLAVIVICVYIIGLKTNKKLSAGTEVIESNLCTLGKAFSDISILDEISAVEAARECSEQLEMKNALGELKSKNIASVDHENYYRLQQYYHGIPVYGRYVVVVASEEGEALNLVSDVKDIPEDISLKVKVTDSQVREKIQDYAMNHWNTVSDEIMVPALSDDQLVIYDQDEKARLAYCFEIFDENHYKIIVDAQNGDVLNCAESVSYGKRIGTNVDKTKSFPVNYDSEIDTYWIEDEEYGISVFNLDGRNGLKNNVKMKYVTSEGNSIFGDTEEEKRQDVDEAIDMLLSTKSIIKKNKQWGQGTPYGQIVLYYNDGWQFGLNAYACDGSVDGKQIGIMSVGARQKCSMETLAHEFTHLVEKEHSVLQGDGKQSKALNEGLADTFAYFVMADWNIKVGERNAVNPAKNGYPEKITDKAHKEDYKHDYATAISHMAYTMYQSNQFSMDQLSHLWFKTMLRLPNDCTYANFRVLMEQTAITSNCTDSQREAIEEAFDQAAITENGVLECGNDIEVEVFDKQGNSYDDYSIMISGKTSRLFGFIGGKDFFTKFDVQQTVPMKLSLKNGTYTITVIDHASGEAEEYKIKVSSLHNGKKHLYVQNFGADYTVSPGGSLVIVDNTGEILSSCQVTAQWENGQKEVECGELNLPEKNYYTILLSYSTGKNTYYDIFTLRIKEEGKDSLTYQTWLSPSELLQDEQEDVVQTLEKKLSRKNYYNSDGQLMFYESYAYYDNGLLCSITLHEIKETMGGWMYSTTEYTTLYLYDETGTLTDTITDSFFGDEYSKEDINQKMVGVDSSKTEDVYGEINMIPFASDGKWAEAYLREEFTGSETAPEGTECRLIYVNDDLIPELYIDYIIYADGSRVYTYQNNKVDRVMTGTGGVRWIEKENLLLDSGGQMDVYYDNVYEIQNGKFVQIADGKYGSSDLSKPPEYDAQGEPIYEYYWDGMKISNYKYEESLNRIFSKENEADYQQNVYTYNQCKQLLRAIAK